MSFTYAAKVVRDHLADSLDDVRVASDVPKSRPAKLVTVTTAPTGGHKHPRWLSWRRVILKCWAATEVEAAQLAEDCRTELLAAELAGLGIHKVLIIGEPSRLDDPDDHTPRFQMTADLLMRSL